MRLDPSLLPRTVPDGIYDAREDTLLLLDAIKLAPAWRTALEVGCGGGLISLHLAKAGMTVMATDINPVAVDFVKREATRLGLYIDARVSDLFSNAMGKYDLIVFNPPYLPSDASDGLLKECDRLALVGGVLGHETARRFAKSVGPYLNGMRSAAYIVVLGEHAKIVTGEKGTVSWSLAKSADFDGEKLAVLKGVPQAINRQ